ncbi:hypothetical protein P8605_06370 [Streptomyces sp. T-3]|nr:hypothetical protein [Streptomyces sp. T-3]
MSQGAVRQRASAVWPFASVAGLVVSIGGCLLVGRAWRDCDIGVNAVAGSGALALVFVPLVAVACAWWGAALGVVGRRAGLAVGALVGVVGSVGVGWGLMAWLGVPEGYPAPICAPDNVPAWWPGWLPV